MAGHGRSNESTRDTPTYSPRVRFADPPGEIEHRRPSRSASHVSGPSSPTTSRSSRHPPHTPIRDTSNGEEWGFSAGDSRSHRHSGRSYDDHDSHHHRDPYNRRARRSSKSRKVGLFQSLLCGMGTSRPSKPKRRRHHSHRSGHRREPSPHRDEIELMNRHSRAHSRDSAPSHRRVYADDYYGIPTSPYASGTRPTRSSANDQATMDFIEATRQANSNLRFTRDRRATPPVDEDKVSGDSKRRNSRSSVRIPIAEAERLANLVDSDFGMGDGVEVEDAGPNRRTSSNRVSIPIDEAARLADFVTGNFSRHGRGESGSYRRNSNARVSIPIDEATRLADSVSGRSGRHVRFEDEEE